MYMQQSRLCYSSVDILIFKSVVCGVFMCVWGSEVEVGCVPQTLSVLFLEPGTQWLDWLSGKAPPSCNPGFLTLGLQALTNSTISAMGVGDVNLVRKY